MLRAPIRIASSPNGQPSRMFYDLIITPANKSQSAGGATAMLSTILLVATNAPYTAIVVCVLSLMFILLLMAFGVRFIPNDRVGIIEKLWSFKGSVSEGRIMAEDGKAGYEPRLLRGGIHFW